MQYGDFYYPMPVNEPVLSYAPGSAEKAALKAALKELKSTKVDVPMYIGNEEIRTGKTVELRPPHERKHLLGYFHTGEAKHVTKAINAALKAKDKWANMSWENRANIFLKAADLLAGKYRPYINGTTMLGQSKNAFQAEIDSACELIDFLRFNVHFLSEIYRQQPISGAGMNNRMEYRPLEGFVFALTPFNFTAIGGNLPTSAAMCGNVVVWKCANTQVYSAQMFMRILKEAGLPDGVFNVVHGDVEIVEAICDHPDIEAVSFVGSTKVAKLVYQRGTANLKRVLALGGAKNHLIVLPDANPAMTAQNVVASMSGCAGQRCMAAGAMLAVGDTEAIIEKICAEARKVIPGQNLGAVISQEAKTRIEKYITEAESQGAKVLVDGRHAAVSGKEGGTYVGPTVIDHVQPDMAIAREEVFGPVISIIRTNTVDEALAIENASPYGNAAAVFTQHGGMARYIIERASAGMIGVNVGVPVPREPFSFGGWNESKFGSGDITGKSSIGFWTRLKKSTVKWNQEAGINWMS